jgi:hypothetical protein
MDVKNILSKVKMQVTDADNLKDMFPVKDYLETKRIYLSIDEIATLWGAYSDSRCASWLIASENSTKEFYEYLLNSI